MTDILLEVVDLTIGIHQDHHNHNLVTKINFSVNHGETLALVGESGSGKSLTALAIMQLLPPSIYIDPTSTILLEKKDLLTFSEIKMRSVRGRKVAIIFQEAIAALNPVLTIGEQISEVLAAHFKLSRKEKYHRTLKILDEVGMPTPSYHYNVYPHQLSGGLKQRAMIAIALAGEPDLLIADEPTTALDVTLQAQVLKLLKTLQEKRGMGLLFITHDLGIVYQIADSVAVMYHGEIVESATTDDFFRAPKHPYSQKLFQSLPSVVAKRSPHPDQDENLLLNVNRLKVYYPIKKGIFRRTQNYVKAVDDISLTLKERRTLALVGESGSGKTTTGMAILRLTPITSGQVCFEGKNIAGLNSSQLRTIRSDLQVVFQDPYASMNPRMLIGDIIAEGMRIKKIPRLERDLRIDQLLEYVGIEPEAKYRYPHEFSGGQRQRICIARALAVEPRLLICDEPTSALDVSAQMQVLNLLMKLQEELGLSYLLITHNIAVVAYMADDVAVMHKGKIVEAGPVDKVLNAPQHPYTQKLLNAVPRVPTHIELIDNNN
jgi:peptide/nickel transport system ATP-binding protein